MRYVTLVTSIIAIVMTLTFAVQVDRLERRVATAEQVTRVTVTQLRWLEARVMELEKRR